ncbi:hypothetical protein FF1_045986 [Malus domestica]
MANDRPRNILITGAAGFIASHVANRLMRYYPEHKIIVLEKLGYSSNLKNLHPSHSSPNFKFIKGDICAQTHVHNYLGNTFEFTKNNVYGTHVLLEACKSLVKSKGSFIWSGDAYYGIRTNIWNSGTTTRGNNVYGPNQFPVKMIPKFILLAMQGKHLSIYVNRSNVRSYLCCEDVADALKSFAIGDRPFHDQRYFIDYEKLKELGWSQQTSWEDGLRKTLDWYVKNPNWWGDVSGTLIARPRNCEVTCI